MFEILSFALFAVIVVFWMDGMRVRELAVAAAKAACKRDDMQFLDDTVSMVSLRFARNDYGRLKARRVYQFEFSDTGDNRLEGSVEMLGKRVGMLYMAPHRIETGGDYPVI